MFCGIAGLLGNIAPTVMSVISATITDHRFIAETVSEMGRGELSWIMDVGFYLNAAGLLALSLGTSHAHLGERGWSLGVFALALLALVVTLIGVWDEFGATADAGSGMSVHTKLTFALAPLYLLGPILMAPGVCEDGEVYRWAFYISAAGWVIFATWFKLAPNGYDGLLEKIAILVTLLWTLPLSWILLRRGLAAWSAS